MLLTSGNNYLFTGKLNELRMHKFISQIYLVPKQIYCDQNKSKCNVHMLVSIHKVILEETCCKHISYRESHESSSTNHDGVLSTLGVSNDISIYPPLCYASCRIDASLDLYLFITRHDSVCKLVEFFSCHLH